jgi:hypothetical protein
MLAGEVSMRWIALLFVGLLVGCGGNVGFNVSRDACKRELPNDATAICFASNVGLRDPNVYLEFDTSEIEFLDWIKRQPNVVRVDKEPPIRIQRFGAYPGDESHETTVLINDGLLFEWYDPNDGDHGDHIAFDRDAGRVYCWTHYF